MYRQITKILLISFLLFIVPQIVQAGFLDDVAYCTRDGSCNFEDMARAFNSLIQMLLGAMGAVALIFFVWGGIRWLISGGSAEKVNQGKTIMINTVFALILAFGSYLILTFFINDVLNVKTDFEITRGEFASCQDAARGLKCGDPNDRRDTKQCSGTIIDGENILSNYSNKCLSACQLQGLIDSGDTKVGECVTVVLPGVDKVPGGGNTCPDISTNPVTKQTCVYVGL